ncbi:hypothetical protein BDP27DRAFT_1418719 [Rhodocollybia butyracea]|uniref:Uncharacterized protein n=1 Tax=Rhodocollybia butyracea TaxID=206335 RepID=A0A9P5Q0L2_9AGAR|nr:hypothetical protein BDP27DRAFT_1418719 [Rhodocollybia butyracea]
MVFASIWIDAAERALEKDCITIMIFRSLSSYSMLLLLELVLMLRVFALYDRSRAIGIFLLFLLALRISTSTYTVQDHIRFPKKMKLTRNCMTKLDFKDPRDPVFVFIYGELAVHMAILGLAMKRTIWDLRQYSHSLFPILNRDGLKVFGAIGVAMIAVAVGSVKTGVPSIFIYPIFIAIVSAAGCHTILNLQKVKLASADANSSEPKKDIELTTIENGSTSIWDTRTFQIVEDDTITEPEQDADLSSSEGGVYVVDKPEDECSYTSNEL